MDPLSVGLGVVSGLSSLGGLLGSAAARRRAERARYLALTEMQRQIEQEYADQVHRNRQGLMAAAGTGADAISALYGRQVEENANLGVFNSTADLGYRAQLTADQARQLSEMGSEMDWNARSSRNAGLRDLSRMRVGMAGEDLARADSDYAGSREGLMRFLGGLSQYNLARSGANQTQNALPRSEGGYGSRGVLQPGAGLAPLASRVNLRAPSLTARDLPSFAERYPRLRPLSFSAGW